ncbi:hypothetical protein [Cellulomonas bogoriensis]|uniref:Uncharacterized protein n=1 Tax=Cellulomonas bogoriensis 69B4 = DSM 16987 TaxID=1386082 RepID=A0A0A0BY89_9CELL|nr:hypothetical protein [Cellulomonas bogoriensis]KGM12886.1 hypothetical protein N869_01030 [Cellulomonas bogoriensis 69B4 = DSM 16987]
MWGQPGASDRDHRTPGSARGTLTLGLLIAVPFVAGGLVLLVGDAPAAGALLLAVGGYALVPVVFIASGRISPGGLWLTPSAVVVRDQGLESRIPWPALVAVAADDDVGTAWGKVLLRADASAGPIHRRRSGPWRAAAHTPLPSLAVLDARWLALDPAVTAQLLRDYQRSSHTSELGTPASLGTIEASAGSV